MREDFFEVVIERPRTRAWSKRRSPYHTLPEHERPRCESMSRNRGGSKYLTDLLGPLRRFLQSRVGRPWDDVMSEVHQRLQAGNHLQQHLLDHFLEMVELQQQTPRHHQRYRFYVDPGGHLRRRPRAH